MTKHRNRPSEAIWFHSSPFSCCPWVLFMMPMWGAGKERPRKVMWLGVTVARDIAPAVEEGSQSCKQTPAASKRPVNALDLLGPSLPWHQLLQSATSVHWTCWAQAFPCASTVRCVEMMHSVPNKKTSHQKMSFAQDENLLKIHLRDFKHEITFTK